MLEDILAADQAKGCRRKALAFPLWILGAAAIVQVCVARWHPFRPVQVDRGEKPR